MKILALLSVFLALPLAAQTTITASGVQNGSGSALSSGQWCVGSTCFTVTSGAIAANSKVNNPTLGNTVYVVTGHTTLLSVPNVSISGTTFNWDNYVIPAGVATSGIGAPYLACQPTATYTNTATLAGYTCANNTSGVATWVANNSGGGGGLSGQTINFLPLATSLTTSTTSSVVSQTATGGILIGSATNVAPSQDPTLDVRRVVGGVISHGVSVDDVLSGGTNPYAAFDSRLEVTGSSNIDHYAGYQDIPTVDVGYTGTLNNLINFVGYANVNGGTVNTRLGFEVNDFIKSGTGSVGTQYGLYINTLTNAGANHGIYVATNDSFFGGGVVAPLKVNNGAAAGPAIVGPWVTVGSYNALSLNGSLSNVLGIVGGTSGDNNLYMFVPSGGSFELGAAARFDIDTATPVVWHADTGISRDAAGVIDVGNGTLGDKSGTVNAAHVVAGNGFSGTKTAGSCVLTIVSGIITNVTGC
jgi:hypothetical protein